MRACLILWLLLGACQKSVEPELTGRLLLTVRGDFKGVDSGYAEVSGLGMALQRAPMTLSDSSAFAELTALPRGSDRRVEVRLYDGLFLCHFGDMRIDILDAAPETRTMTLRRVERPVTSCIASGLTCDTSGGNYRLTWTPYSDSLQFKTDRLSYVLVKDTAAISDDFKYYTGRVIFSENIPDTAYCEYPVNSDSTDAYFKMFLYSETYKTIINDCDNTVFFR